MNAATQIPALVDIRDRDAAPIHECARLKIACSFQDKTQEKFQ
jgi:hypothetical protein